MNTETRTDSQKLSVLATWLDKHDELKGILPTDQAGQFSHEIQRDLRRMAVKIHEYDSAKDLLRLTSEENLTQAVEHLLEKVSETKKKKFEDGYAIVPKRKFSRIQKWLLKKEWLWCRVTGVADDNKICVIYNHIFFYRQAAMIIYRKDLGKKIVMESWIKEFLKEIA